MCSRAWSDNSVNVSFSWSNASWRKLFIDIPRLVSLSRFTAVAEPSTELARVEEERLDEELLKDVKE